MRSQGVNEKVKKVLTTRYYKLKHIQLVLSRRKCKKVGGGFPPPFVISD
jgi:hypothetical protein